MKIALAALIAAALVATPASAASLDDYLHRHYTDSFDPDGLRYERGDIDLNSDGSAEAIVWLTSRGWCGSGGCKLLVLRRTHGGFKVVGSTTITRPPIRALKSRGHGWRDIAVGVSGGGERWHEAILRFDGRRYPSNPTMPPAWTGTWLEPGDTIIAVHASPGPE